MPSLRSFSLDSKKLEWYHNYQLFLQTLTLSTHIFMSTCFDCRSIDKQWYKLKTLLTINTTRTGFWMVAEKENAFIGVSEPWKSWIYNKSLKRLHMSPQKVILHQDALPTDCVSPQMIYPCTWVYLMNSPYFLIAYFIFLSISLSYSSLWPFLVFRLSYYFCLLYTL